MRWGLFALEPPLWSLWPLQVLHTLTFAATFLAGVQLVERLSPPDSHTAAQTLSSMLSAGVLIGLATLASGPLFDRLGAGGYWAMAALAAVGGVVAGGVGKDGAGAARGWRCADPPVTFDARWANATSVVCKRTFRGIQ